MKLLVMMNELDIYMYDFIIISCDNNMKDFFQSNKKIYLFIKKLL
jgi:hypothetical protein